MDIDAISLAPFLVFSGLGYLLHAGVEFLRDGNLRYYVYLFQDGTTVHESIIYGYNQNLQIERPGEGNRARTTKLAARNEVAVLIMHIVRKNKLIDF